MFRFSCADEKAKYDLSELARMFLPAEEFEFIVDPSCADADLAIPASDDKNESKRLLYSFLSEKLGKRLEWGILTGVRPVKLFRESAERLRSPEDAAKLLSEAYLVSDEKIALLRGIYEVQRGVTQSSDPNTIGVYIGIPFCPSRCLYCSFTSNVYKREASDRYLEALYKEIDAVREIMDAHGWSAESIYIGGGTPTSLEEDQFEALLEKTCEAFAGPGLREFTVESGRPETITEGKLASMKRHGAGRMSINPQTMKQHTLDLIGRLHTPQQIEQAFRLAQAAGIPDINADLITGLPEETPEDFRDSLEKVIALGPTDITVHTLAVKRASRLKEQDSAYSYKMAETAAQMLDISRRLLTQAGYEPYYMYRQKQMAGNFENVGWCRPGHASLYNIRIMVEDQTILALGAGGISKQFFPAENRLERVANVSNYEIYIERIDEMIQRKKEGIK